MCPSIGLGWPWAALLCHPHGATNPMGTGNPLQSNLHPLVSIKSISSTDISKQLNPKLGNSESLAIRSRHPLRPSTLPECVTMGISPTPRIHVQHAFGTTSIQSLDELTDLHKENSWRHRSALMRSTHISWASQRRSGKKKRNRRCLNNRKGDILKQIST